MKKLAVLLGICFLGLSLNAQSLKQNKKLSGYGGKLSVGAAIGGGSLLGVPIRIYPTEKVALEFSVGLRPVITIGGTTEYTINVFTGGDLNVFFSKTYNNMKNRVQMNGLFAKAGGSFGERYKESLFAFGWVYERIKDKNKNKSLNLELGIGVIKLTDKYFVGRDYYYYSADESLGTSIKPLLYWKVSWNFFVVK